MSRSLRPERRSRGRRPRRHDVAGLVVVVGALVLGPAVAPAYAEGPGYGGGADNLSVSWQSERDAGAEPEPTKSTQEPAPEPTPTKSTQEPAPEPAPTKAEPAPTKEEPAPEPAPTKEEPAPEPAPTKEEPAPEPAPQQEEPAPQQEEPAPQQEEQPQAAGPVVVAGRGAAAAIPAVDVPTVTDAGLVLVVDGVGFRGRSEVEVRVGSADPFLARVDDTGTLDVDVPARTAETAGVGTSVVAIGRSPSGTSLTLVGAIPPRPTGTGPVDLVPWVVTAIGLAMGGSWLVARIAGRRTEETT